MKVNVRITYEMPLSRELDKAIRVAAEAVGMDEYASGGDMEYEGRPPGLLIRDISFDWDIEAPEVSTGMPSLFE